MNTIFLKSEQLKTLYTSLSLYKSKDKLDLGLISKEDYEAKKTELVKFIK
jgi:hypothetical protein